MIDNDFFPSAFVPNISSKTIYTLCPKCRQIPVINLLKDKPKFIRIECLCSYKTTIEIETYISMITISSKKLKTVPYKTNCDFHSKFPYQSYCRKCKTHYCIKCMINLCPMGHKDLYQLNWFGNEKRISFLKEKIKKAKEFLNIKCSTLYSKMLIK